MAKSNKRRKVLIFSVIAAVLAGLTAVAIFKKREVTITVQTEKITRRNLTEIVVANGRIQPVLQVNITAEVQPEKSTRRALKEIGFVNGRIQPVLQVNISAEVSGEIIDLPVKEGQAVKKGDLLVKIKPEFFICRGSA